MCQQPIASELNKSTNGLAIKCRVPETLTCIQMNQLGKGNGIPKSLIVS